MVLLTDRAPPPSIEAPFFSPNPHGFPWWQHKILPFLRIFCSPSVWLQCLPVAPSLLLSIQHPTLPQAFLCLQFPTFRLGWVQCATPSLGLLAQGVWVDVEKGELGAGLLKATVRGPKRPYPHVPPLALRGQGLSQSAPTERMCLLSNLEGEGGRPKSHQQLWVDVFTWQLAR